MRRSHCEERQPAVKDCAPSNLARLCVRTSNTRSVRMKLTRSGRPTIDGHIKRGVSFHFGVYPQMCRSLESWRNATSGRHGLARRLEQLAECLVIAFSGLQTKTRFKIQILELPGLLRADCRAGEIFELFCWRGRGSVAGVASLSG